jgi:hypothetical protein
MKQCATRISPQVFLTLFLLLFVTLFHQAVSAQTKEEEPPPDLAPPPLKLLSKDEQKSLEAQNDVKKRVKISLELMDARLLKAEQYKTEESFKETLIELAGFHAILDNTMNFLVKNNTDGDRVDKRFITFEIYLRKQIPRLEVIRRELPTRYGYHVGKLMLAVREARAKAVEPIFSDTVVPDNKKPNEK